MSSCAATAQVYLADVENNCPGPTGPACPCRRVPTFRHRPCPTQCPVVIPPCSPVIGATGILNRLRSVFDGGFLAPTPAELDAADCNCNCIEVPINLYDATIIDLVTFGQTGGVTVVLAFCSSNSRTSCVIVDPSSPNSASELTDGTTLTVTLTPSAFDAGGSASFGPALLSEFFS